MVIEISKIIYDLSWVIVEESDEWVKQRCSWVIVRYPTKAGAFAFSVFFCITASVGLSVVFSFIALKEKFTGRNVQIAQQNQIPAAPLPVQNIFIGRLMMPFQGQSFRLGG